MAKVKWQLRMTEKVEILEVEDFEEILKLQQDRCSSATSGCSPQEPSLLAALSPVGQPGKQGPRHE